MCGIAGALAIDGGRQAADLETIARRMSDALTHRGPDDSGVFVDPAQGLALGFRRLAIIDLTQAGHQPMQSSSGRYVVVFNGEIYNHRLLRAELTGVAWRGHSDTEVMLAAFDRWGVEGATRRFNGMFAFAVWDREHRVLTLGRDRMGEKPLYVGRVGERIVFGSELKSLRAAPGFSSELDRDAVTAFLRFGYVPAPLSVYRGISKLLPGHLLDVTGDGMREPRAYWSARAASQDGLASPLAGSDEELADQLEGLLLDAVGLRMDADVALGSFLSGGIDSSLIVALMQAQRSDPVRTFTIGFNEQGYDEAPHAKAIASHLGTAHTELYVTPKEARSVIPLLPQIYDEPFSDSSQIPTYLVSRLARRDVAVCLSGDGGDELFGGYSRYLLLADLWERLQRVPSSVRHASAYWLTAVPTSTWDIVFRSLRPLLPARARQEHWGDKLHKLAGVLRQDRPEDVYVRLVSLWDEPSNLVLSGREPPTALTNPSAVIDTASPVLRAMQLDAVTYLPDDILVKVDRASMAVSLEARVPLLDHRLYEFAWRLPDEHRIRGTVGKHLLRKVLQRYVPTQLFERPKMGFGVPIGAWLRGPLNEWAEDLLSQDRLETQGLLDPRPVREAWEGHRSGTIDEKYRLWAVLTLQAWLDGCA